jgi:hypothetical protein
VTAPPPSKPLAGGQPNPHLQLLPWGLGATGGGGCLYTGGGGGMYTGERGSPSCNSSEFVLDE